MFESFTTWIYPHSIYVMQIEMRKEMADFIFLLSFYFKNIKQYFSIYSVKWGFRKNEDTWICPSTKSVSWYWLTFLNRSGHLLGAQLSISVSCICQGLPNWLPNPGLELRSLQFPGTGWQLAVFAQRQADVLIRVLCL